MKRQLVYDLPTRIFHWLFAGLFLFSFLVAKIVDDESTVFSYHMISGLLMGLLVILRLIWGFVGTRHARFSGFNLNTGQLISYLQSVMSKSDKQVAGHNPASSWTAILMFLLGLGLSTTGYLMATGGKESFEDVHEVLAYSFAVLVLLHIIGVFLHMFRHNDLIAFSMIDGTKNDTIPSAPIESQKGIHAGLLIFVFVGAALFLLKNFDQSNRTLKVFGQTLQLGESEEEKDDHE